MRAGGTLGILLVLLALAAAPLAAQQPPRNFWDLSEPAHTEQHAEQLQGPAPDSSAGAQSTQPAPAPQQPTAPASTQTAPAPPEPTAPAAAGAPPATTAPVGGAGTAAPSPAGSANAPATAPQGESNATPAPETETALESARSIEVLYRLGERARRRGDAATAERYFQLVLQRAPYHFLTHLALGRLYLSGNPARARDELEIAQRIHPSSELAHYLLGQAYEALGRDLDAAEEYRRVIYINPRQYDANARLRGVLRRMRSGRSVVQRAADSFYEHPSLASLTLFGRIVLNQTEPRQAVLEFEEVKRRLPDLTEVELWLARAHHAADDLPEEVSAYRRYLDKRPEATGVRLLLVERLAEQGWYDDAATLMKPLEANGSGLPPIPPASRARLTFVRSRLLSAERQPGLAGEMLMQAHGQGYRDEEIGKAFAEDLALFPDAGPLWFAYAEWLRATNATAQAADALSHAGLLDTGERSKARTTLEQMRRDGKAPAASALALAQLAWADQDGATALKLLADVPAGNPLDHRAALLRGMIHRARGEVDAALDAFTQYVFFFSDPRDMLYARGNLFWNLGNVDAALAVWRENPDVLLRHPDVLLHVAQHYRDAGDTKNEIATRERLAQALPANDDNRIRLGDLYMQQGRRLEAALLWERVLKDRPRDADLLDRTGKAWVALGNSERALPLLQRAAQLHALDPDTSAALAAQFYNTHRFEDALRMYWSLYQQQPERSELPRVLPELVLSIPATHEQRMVAAKLAMHAGRLEQAAQVYEALLDDEPQANDVRMALVEIYLRQDKPKQAEAVMNAPGANAATDEQGLRLMATVQERMGRKTALAATLGRLQELHPDDAALMRKRGLLLAELRKPAEARALLVTSLDAAPHDVELLMALADVEAKLGDTQGAEQHWKAALAADPQRSDAQRRLIDMMLQEQRWEDAAQQLESWVSDHPRDALARYNLVSAYLKLFRKDAAQPHYEALRALNPVRARSLEPYFR